MFVGVIEFDLLLGDVHSLKEKRGTIRPIIAALKKLDVAVAEVGEQDLYRRTHLAAATVATDAAHCREVLDRCDRMVVGFPEVQVLGARQRLFGDHDE